MTFGQNVLFIRHPLRSPLGGSGASTLPFRGLGGFTLLRCRLHLAASRFDAWCVVFDTAKVQHSHCGSRINEQLFQVFSSPLGQECHVSRVSLRVFGAKQLIEYNNKYIYLLLYSMAPKTPLPSEILNDTLDP